jgi:uncharacterized LabA/DUF88 family protein
MEKRLAVLIDADNVPYSHIKEMMEELSKNGILTIKRIYADWTRPTANGWKSVLLENAITPIQQYSYTSGKNSSDSALIIDAMDILYSGRVDGFCIVSSDSDFTRLATRLREAGMLVIGLGERKTPKPFIASCDKFVYLEILKETPEIETVNEPAKTKQTSASKLDAQTRKLISQSVNDLADDDGYTSLATLGNFILKKQPEFDPRNYGFAKLLTLIKAMEMYEIDARETGIKNMRHIYIKPL